MGEKHQNQYTTPPMTEAEAIQSAKTLLVRTCGKGPRGKDRMALFAEWLRSDPKEFPNAGTWMAGQGLHRMTLQKWGGRTFWNRAREAVRAEALARTIERTPDVIAKKYERELAVSMKLIDVVDKYAERLKKDPEPPQPLPDGATDQQRLEYTRAVAQYRAEMRSVPADAIKTLAEAVEKLADTNLKIAGDGPKQAAPTFNFATVVNAIQERDKQFGVQ